MMSFSGNKGAIWAAWLLSTCGFAILLGGVASMQNDCSANINALTLGGVGTPGYLAPVSCGHFFQYTWWITFLHFFTWVMVLAYLVMDVIHKNRAALVGILAVAAVLLMDTANTYLQYNYLPGLTGTMLTRARVTVAGAIIAAVADLLLILLVGWHDDKTTYKERGETTAKMMSFSGNKGAIWAAWLLSTCGFAILLAGVASMQNDCDGSLLSTLTLGGGGTPGYLAPVSCGKFFRYTWYITFLHFFTWVMVLAYLVTDKIHKNRAALVGILAVAAVLLMDTANTYLNFDYIPGLSGSLLTRARVTVAGACVAAAADLLLILLVGWHDERTTYKERHERDIVGAGYPAGNTMYTTTPATTTAGVHNTGVHGNTSDLHTATAV
ncbi:hypothetical protein ACK3TF_006065 [Chlorella vulgaris]